MPRGGGLAIGLGFSLPALAITWLAGPSALTADNPAGPMLINGLLVGGLAALALGALDDLRDLRPGAQLAGQLGVGVIAVASRLWLERFTNPLSGQTIDIRAALPGAIGTAIVVGLTLLWYAGFINTVNWLDGVDGLAAGTGALAAGLFAMHMLVAFDQRTLALYPLVLAGACLGFLPENLARRRVFMGSSGSTFLGFTLGAMALIAPAKVATALLVMAVPIVDVAWQILARLRGGVAPWRADRGHLHHRLYDRGWSPVAVLALYLTVAGAAGAVALLTPQAAGMRAAVKLGALGAIAAGTVAGLWHLARQEDA
ncbi:MAG TPA: MraY family glycosyltransferase [Dongiaceae bacterium]|nr:MraY family glycosyltransferase [Dongiaceae bacterium]